MYVQKNRDKLSRICLENWPFPTNAFKENRRSSSTRRVCTPGTHLKMKNVIIQCSLVTAFTGSYLSYFYAVEIVFFNPQVINVLFLHILAVAVCSIRSTNALKCQKIWTKTLGFFYCCIVLPFLVQNYSIIKGLSQKQKMVEVVITSQGCLVQTLCSSWDIQSCLPRTMLQWLLNISKDRLHGIPGQPVTYTTMVKRYFLIFRGKSTVFQFVPIGSDPVTGHHWEELLSYLHCPFSYFYTLVRSP